MTFDTWKHAQISQIANHEPAVGKIDSALGSTRDDQRVLEERAH